MSSAPTERSPLQEAYSWLVGLRPRGIRLGLARVEAALDALGRPHERLRAVIIAGTNGKGSTAAFTAAIAHAAGYRVGLYTSPHLEHFTERIRISGAKIQPSELVRWAGRLRRVVEGADGEAPIPLTFFEALTVIAIGYFVEREVDLAVLEVGLGGRLDATSVVPPLVGVVTPIGLDHQEYLGETREEICREKAGILRAGTTLVTSVDEELFRDALGPYAFGLRCPIRRHGIDFVHQWLPRGFRYRGWIHRVGPVSLGIRGVHQGINASVACAVAESLSAHGFSFKAQDLAEGLMRARHPGRLERREPTRLEGEAWPALLLDAAHNPMGARVLRRHVAAFLPERPRILLFGINPEKDVPAMLRELAPVVDGIVLTAAAARPVERWESLLEVARRWHRRVVFRARAVEGLEVARELSGPAGGVLIAGSIYLLGELWPRLPK